MEEKLIKKLMASMKCEECGQNYESGNIDVIGHREDMWFMRVPYPMPGSGGCQGRQSAGGDERLHRCRDRRIPG